jgi:hypothetical protein
VIKRILLFIGVFSIMIMGATFISINTSASAACITTANTVCPDYTSLPQVTNPGSSTLSTMFTLVFSVIGAISLIVITLAGFSYITSRGEPEKTARAKDTILYAIIGIVVASLGVTIVSFVAGHF